MLNKKLAGLLVVPAMLATMGASHAISNTASQTLQCTLGNYIDIQPVTSGAVTTTTIAPDTGNLATALISKFAANLNSATQLYLQATVGNSASTNDNALFQQGANRYVVFGNITNKPTSAAIADCKAATPNPTTNVNAIAYPIASVTLDNSGTSTYDGTKNQYNISANPGVTNFTTTTGTTVLANTYSYLDSAGTYQAIVTLTSTSL